MRKFTNKILEMTEEGLFDRDILICDLLMWMSEQDVEDFYNSQMPDAEDEE